MGFPMTCRFGSMTAGVATLAFLSLGASALTAPAMAGDLPAVKASDTNKPMQCATPGRLMAYVRERNPKLEPKFEGLATEYMRHGEALQVRWDFAFFQMLLETGYLTYKGDVKPSQNNFAGLGATGGGVRGESFKDVSTGAKAHLQHLLMYTGTHVADPVAERTRNVQEWGVLTKWQQQFSEPITFAQVARQWAPGSKNYVRDVETIADRFINGACNGPDPQPELVAEALGTGADKAAVKTVKTVAVETAPTKGQDAKTRAVEDAKATGAKLAALGAKEQAKAAEAEAAQPAVTAALPDASAAAASKSSPQVKVLNAAPENELKAADASTSAEPAKPQAEKTAKADKAKAEKPIEVAALAATGAAAKATATQKAPKASQDANAKGKCRVWTASYGGQKAIIIKAVAEKTVNYTVLDVNDGTEKREAEAYINAYAKGGQTVGEFTTQSQALDKAFELCPEG